MRRSQVQPGEITGLSYPHYSIFKYVAASPTVVGIILVGYIHNQDPTFGRITGGAAEMGILPSETRRSSLLCKEVFILHVQYTGELYCTVQVYHTMNPQYATGRQP